METQHVHRNAWRIEAWIIIAGAHAALQWLDLGSTYLALNNGGYEANPISRAILDTGGWAAYGAIKSGVACFFLAMPPMLRTLSPTEARWVGAMMTVFAIFMAAVVTNNLLIAL